MQNKTRNLAVFLLLMSVPTIIGVVYGQLLYLLIFVHGDFVIPFTVPEWLVWMIRGLIPGAVFLQSVLIYMLFLRIQRLQREVVRIWLLDFLLGFVPAWSWLLCWTLFWGTAEKLSHMPPTNPEQLFSNLTHAVVCGTPLSCHGLIASACIGTFVAFFIQSFRNLFGEWFISLKLMRQGVQSCDGSVAAGS